MSAPDGTKHRPALTPVHHSGLRSIDIPPTDWWVSTRSDGPGPAESHFNAHSSEDGFAASTKVVAMEGRSTVAIAEVPRSALWLTAYTIFSTSSSDFRFLPTTVVATDKHLRTRGKASSVVQAISANPDKYTWRQQKHGARGTALHDAASVGSHFGTSRRLISESWSWSRFLSFHNDAVWHALLHVMFRKTHTHTNTCMYVCI